MTHILFIQVKEKILMWRYFRGFRECQQKKRRFFSSL